MADADLAPLCVFARAPVAGEVKRRLAEAMGQERALSAHEMLVVDTLERLHACHDVAPELWLAGHANETVRVWSRRYGLTLHRQQGADLGARMCHALRDALDRAGRALLIGTDCPTIDADYLTQALGLLRHHDVVMGPAEDGGYGLIGADARCAAQLHRIFSGVHWGTSGVAAATRRLVQVAGWRLAELPPIWDVDTYADWRRYEALRAVSEDSPPAQD